MSLVPTTDESTQLIASVGDFGDSFLATNLPSVWARYDGVSGRLQFLYTRRDLIDLAMGEVRKRVSFDAPQDVGVDASDLIKALLAMKKDILAEIAREEDTLVIAGTGEVFYSLTGEMLTTGSTSVAGLPRTLDANSAFYRGQPYQLPPRRIP